MVKALPDVRCCLTLTAALCSEVTSFINTFTAGNRGSARVRDWLNPTQPVDISSRRSGLEVSGSQIFCCRLLWFVRTVSYTNILQLEFAWCWAVKTCSRISSPFLQLPRHYPHFMEEGAWAQRGTSTCPRILEAIAWVRIQIGVL